MLRLQQGFATGGIGSNGHCACQQSSGPNVRFGSKADIGAGRASCPLYPQKRTLDKRVEVSALCQKRTSGCPSASPTCGQLRGVFGDSFSGKQLQHKSDVRGRVGGRPESSTKLDQKAIVVPQELSP